MLKITTYQKADLFVVKLEGAIKGPWVDELSKVWLGMAQQNRGEKILVDLQGVRFADSRGQALLLRMQQEGASFIEPSAFLRFVLEQGARDVAD